jgi:hypothetical protein
MRYWLCYIRAMRRNRWLGAGVIVSIAIAAPIAHGSFTSTATVPVALSIIPSVLVPITVGQGSYSQPAAAGSTIATVGFTPDLILVKGDGARSAVVRTSTMTGSQSKVVTSTAALPTTGITSLSATGFTTGTHTGVSGDGGAFRYLALKATPGAIQVGSYTGNGATTQSVLTAGIMPRLVWVFPAGSYASQYRFSRSNATNYFNTSAANNNIQSFSLTGFTAAGGLNANGVVYHWVAFNDNGVDGMSIKSFIGNAPSTQTVSIPFQADYIFGGADSTGRAYGRPIGLTGNATQLFTASANSANLITAINSNSISVGSATGFNTAGVSVDVLALKRTAP